MGHMTPTSRMTPTCMGGVYTKFTISPSFKIKKLILTLGSHKFFMVWPRTYLGWMNSRMFKFPQMTPIVRPRFAPKAQMKGQWPKEPKKMNLLESRLKDELSMS